MLGFLFKFLVHLLKPLFEQFCQFHVKLKKGKDRWNVTVNVISKQNDF